MAKAVKGIPEGFHTITPYLVVKDAARAIDFYKRAFGAEEVMRMPGPDGKGIMHAEIRIGNSPIMLSDEWPDMGFRSPLSFGGVHTSLHIYVENADAAYKRAVDAGATAKMPLADMFWGDRYGKVTDPFGHVWGIATNKETVSPEELRKRSKTFFADMAKNQERSQK
jgi:PhnB protein